MSGRKPRRVLMPVPHIAAVKRVLRLVDGYASVDEDRLMAWNGGAMTWRDIREHIQTAIKLLPKGKP